MGFYVLCGLETDKQLREMTKRYILADIVKRRDCIKALSFSGGGKKLIHIEVNKSIIELHSILILV